ncbi:MAG: hypothetical protein JSS75_09245 [Bacteroidetes bacterium]|nr:hypothetical protein [Bacteroidota bacterium]
MRTVIVLLSISLTIGGCVSTHVTSLVDPLYRDSSYARILVIGSFPTIEATKLAEQHLVRDLTDSGTFAIANTEILPPLRKYSDSEITLIYRKYDLDACVVISPTSERSNLVYVPGWTHIDNSIHQNTVGTSVTTSVNSIPGNYQQTNYIGTKAELRDIKTGALVCRCETNSKHVTEYATSSSSSENDYVMNSICEKIVGELEKNKLLKHK